MKSIRQPSVIVGLWSGVTSTGTELNRQLSVERKTNPQNLAIWIHWKSTATQRCKGRSVVLPEPDEPVSVVEPS
jgi:hypothetical protein